MPDSDKSLRRYTDYLVKELDALARIYYGFWIIFLAGFVLSLHVSVESHANVAYVLLILFRILAILGTAANFMMQRAQLAALRSGNAALYTSELVAALHSAGQMERVEMMEAKHQEVFNELAKKEKLTDFWDFVLRVITGLFLLVAFIGSFFVRIP